jgi:lipoprotein-anchoring transpeptidase ErfK/SrfK
MATWKDDEAATEALRGGAIKTKRGVGMKKYIGFAAAAAILALAVVAVRFLRPGALSVAAREVPAIKEPDSPARQQAPEAPAAKPTRPIIADTPVIIMPPVTIEVKHKPANPLENDRPELGKFSEARAALRAANFEAALASLKALNAHPLDESEKQEAVVLEARAQLASGNIEDARKKFEPMAFLSSETAAGADALLGNFWCQAGSLSRVRSSELQLVLRGPRQSWGNAMAALEEGRRTEEKAAGDMPALEQARALYQQAFDANQLDDKHEKDCLARLQDLTQRIILDPKVACASPKAVFHKVEAGDVVERIAKKYKVNQGQIKALNRLTDKLTVREGQVLKMLPGDVVYKVSRSRLTGVLYIDGVFIHYYRVGIGPGNATPQGLYTIDKKLVNPDWYYDGRRVPFGEKENILGTRWMGFATAENGGQGAGLGVHGTAFPESVPGRESKGCVRMHNKDVEELYDLMPQGGKVRIVD